MKRVDIFVARQPILNTNQKICAYELLYRNDNDSIFSEIDDEQATSNVINSALQIGFEELSEGKPCFINFTEKLLEGTIPVYLHPEMVVIEILETVSPTDKLIENCKILKSLGYKIALDDLSLSYKLLKLINSPIIGPIHKIKSIKQAIVFLGLKELKKWIYVLSFQTYKYKSDSITNEVIKMCFIRAKAGEWIAHHTGNRKESASYFLIGMFSLIDTLMKRPLDTVLKQLPLDINIRETILGNKTPYSDIVDLVVATERADWSEIGRLSVDVGISIQELFGIYKESMKWAKQLMEESLYQEAVRS